MIAVLQEKYGDESTLSVGATEVPVPHGDELLIRVSCSALNQMDLLQCK
jgi:NADPH:quinone reductase-like Zn-dependent oxidoreductase